MYAFSVVKVSVKTLNTESERRRLEPVARLSNLEGEVLSMLLVYRNMVVADCLESVCESLTNDVQGIYLEIFNTQKLVEF